MKTWKNEKHENINLKKKKKVILKNKTLKYLLSSKDDKHHILYSTDV